MHAAESKSRDGFRTALLLNLSTRQTPRELNLTRFRLESDSRLTQRRRGRCHGNRLRLGKRGAGPCTGGGGAMSELHSRRLSHGSEVGRGIKRVCGTTRTLHILLLRTRPVNGSLSIHSGPRCYVNTFRYTAFPNLHVPLLHTCLSMHGDPRRYVHAALTGANPRLHQHQPLLTKVFGEKSSYVTLAKVKKAKMCRVLTYALTAVRKVMGQLRKYCMFRRILSYLQATESLLSTQRQTNDEVHNSSLSRSEPGTKSTNINDLIVVDFFSF